MVNMLNDHGGQDMMMTVIVGEPVLLRAVKKRDGDKEETGQDRYHHDVDEEKGNDFGLF